MTQRKGNTMQVEFYAPTPDQALPPVEWNYDELKAWITESLAKYKGLVYTDENIAQAKKDRALLNKLVDAIDTARKEKKAQYLAPYAEFERQAKELAALVKEQSDEIDKQAKAYDERKKEKKLDDIRAIYAEKIGELAALVPYERLHDPKWLNVTTSMQSIEKALTEKIDGIRAALTSIDALGLDEDIAIVIKTEYLVTFDLAAALSMKDRIIAQRTELANLKAAQAQPTAAQGAAEVAQSDKSTPEAETAAYVDFRVFYTHPEQLQKLKAFLNENGIKYGRVTP